jgi:cellulose synthase/poly-beta-1,6-N-acetylglucosamine synthase-like glycosyltransferase
MKISDYLTIVIPCKNEKNVIIDCLTYLDKQTNIEGTNVYICDSSNDRITKNLIKLNEFNNLNIEMLSGGLPAKARNIGFKHSKTIYTLFLDADVFLKDKNLLLNCVHDSLDNYLDLLTVKFKTLNGKYDFAYIILDFLRKMVSRISPFCLGGFMFFRTLKLRELGGFNNECVFAEDYELSKRVEPKKFKVSKQYAYTLNRRFESKGIYYMGKMLFKSFINRNNPEFFKQSHKYWD